LRHGLGADVAAGTGPVLYNDRLVPLRLKLVGNDARDRVGSTAGLDRNDDLDQPFRILVLPDDRRGGGEQETDRSDRRSPNCTETCILPKKRRPHGILLDSTEARAQRSGLV